MRRKAKLATLIVVGEGPNDKAFLSHLKSVYDGRSTGQAVKVDSADGGSPSDIINAVIRKCRHTNYDKRFILLDSDVPIRQQDHDRARQHKIRLIISTPICLEGMLLEILNQRPPDTNNACKDILHPQLSGNPTSARSYAELFTKDLLDKVENVQIVELRNVIANTR